MFSKLLFTEEKQWIVLCYLRNIFFKKTPLSYRNACCIWLICNSTFYTSGSFSIFIRDFPCSSFPELVFLEYFKYLEELTVFLIIYFKRWLISNCNGIVILCNKIIQVLFSKLMCCVCQVTFFCTKCPLKRRAFLQKDMLGKRWSAVKSFWWHMGKIILYWKISCLTTKNIISSL